jgi:6-phosphofructokinase 1
MRELVGNVLLLQMGTPSVVTNVLLSALVKRALNYDCVDEIYGCVGGYRGILGEQFVDLAEQPQKNISNLIGTPGAALKSFPFDDIETTKIVDILQKHNIRYLFVMGDVSSIDHCKKISDCISKSNYEVRLILIPTSPDNSVQLTDHCLGYGSMAKHLAVMGKSIITDVQSTQPNGGIIVIELGKCVDEWMISSVALARFRKDSMEAPHLIILSNFDEGTFVKNVHQTIKNTGNCVVVVGDRLTNLKGENLAVQRRAAEHVKFIAEANFDVQVDLVTLNDWKLTSCMTLSGVDVTESDLCAQKALELAIAIGVSGKMITLLRSEDGKCSSEVNCVDLENVPDKRKVFPESWYVYEEMAMDIPFFKYASQLIAGEVRCQYENGLPAFAKFR